MNRKQMEYFIEVYRCGNIQTAADYLYVARQGLSRAMRSLEEELGQPLFTRTPGGIIPTDYAAALLPHVQRLLDEYQSIESMTSFATHSKSVVAIFALDHVFSYNGFIGEKSVTHGATPPSVFFAQNLRLLHVCFVQQPPLITHQQGQTGLSTVGAAHSLAVDRLGWIC